MVKRAVRRGRSHRLRNVVLHRVLSGRENDKRDATEGPRSGQRDREIPLADVTRKNE